MAPPTCGNPLLQQWMKEEMLRTQATSSKMYYTYKKAYESLSKCPIVFEHPYQAVQLEGIGPKIVDMLTDKMKAYCQEHGLPMPPAPYKVKRKRPPPIMDDGDDDIQLDENGAPIPFRPKKKAKAYIPQYRTGGYGILLALLDIHDYGRCDATQQQIVRLAQDHCNVSYTLAEPGKNYTAWNSMGTLVSKGYVYKNGSPKKYQLTETGVELAQKLKEINESRGAGGATGSGSASTSIPRSRSTTLPTSSGAAFAAAIGSDSEDDGNGIDMSHYVLNPEQHSSISINGRTSTTSSSNPSTARSRKNRSRFDDDDDLGDLSGIDWDAIDRQSQEQQQRQRQQQHSRQASPPRPFTSSSRADILETLAINASASGSGRKGATNNSRSKQSKGGGLTSSLFESLLDSMGGERDLTRPDMSLYVMNPSQHQTISLNGITATNTSSISSSNYSDNNNSSSSNSSRPTSNIPSKPTSITASTSATNASSSSFARRVMNQADNNYDSELIRPRKYKTPDTSSILMNDAAAKNNKQKRQYNVDEYEMDLTTNMTSLPTLGSTQLIQPSNGDIVDLLSSPETSPRLHHRRITSPKEQEEELTFDDPFDLDQDYFPMSQSRNRKIADDTFHFTYLDTSNQPQRHLAKAAVDIDDVNGGLAYLVKYQTKQGSHPKAKHLIKRSVKGEFTLAYLPEIHGETVCPGLPATPVLPLHQEEEDSFWPASICTTSNSTTVRNKSSAAASAAASPSPSIASDSQPLLPSPSLASDSQRLFPFSSSQNYIASQPFLSSQQSKKLDFDAIVAREPITETLRPGEYEIVLVVDSREIQMKQNRTYFQDCLTAKGVPCITRSMGLGDVIWIARPIGSTNRAEELFLDYIVERKRLDDLVSSIKDGRFIEQKTRLKRSGANKVIYVVENYNREEAERFGMQAVQTAMSSTQIIDGIFLKRTNTIDETVDYLVSATKLLKHMYQEHTLHAIPGHIITRKNYLDLKQAYNKKAGEKEAYLVSYPLFGQLNSKHGSTSVHEVYLRMLMTIRGVNAEKALSLMKVYPTPKSLLMAFQGKSPKEAKNLAKVATQEHINRRRWSAKISESLYEIWGAIAYPGSDDDNGEQDY
ncbi:crossover junction endonuclease mus81 protein [Mucor ambiguus]|uniref:Crossover junction endonuclease MUS81 n=1 Tax=Mucor ambiguus TaxID=91626 RepID=A0A0C9M0V1_9FUNG|nr:crossover junction endonuclease mus81 protein [Mucor ambiguus]